MKIKTSTDISRTEIASIEDKLRGAARDANNLKFFGDDDRFEVESGSQYPTVEELASKAKSEPKPLGDPTLCAIAYELAKEACDGNSLCLALAAIAYKECLES